MKYPIMGEQCLPRHCNLMNTKSSTRYELSPFNLLDSRVLLISHEYKQPIDTGVVYHPELDGKILLLKVTDTLVIELKEIKRVLTWTFISTDQLSYCQKVLCLLLGKNGLPNQPSYPAINPGSYRNDWLDMICPLLKQ